MYVRTSLTADTYVTLNSATFSATGARSTVFTTGSAGGYRIGKLALFVRTAGGSLTDQYSLKVDLRASAAGLPSTAVYATTTMSFFPATVDSLTLWKLAFNETEMGAIATRTLAATTKYALSVYNLQLVSTSALTDNITMGAASTSNASMTAMYSDGFSGAVFFSAQSKYAGSFNLQFGP